MHNIWGVDRGGMKTFKKYVRNTLYLIMMHKKMITSMATFLPNAGVLMTKAPFLFLL